MRMDGQKVRQANITKLIVTFQNFAAVYDKQYSHHKTADTAFGNSNPG